MTLKTWKKEFYPVPAKRRMSRRKAIEHSLRKWTGLRKVNLKRHNMTINSRYVEEKNDRSQDMVIDDETCALCQKYQQVSYCTDCPLYENLGGRRCDNGDGSPYMAFLLRGDPLPMIKALKATLKAEAQS